jgi:ABC-type polysaccharide/polyol phosphate export permease
LFFVSPILYDAKRFEGSPLEIILNLNPITPFITLFRDIIYYNRMPDLNTTLLALTLTSISIMIGYLFFSQMKNKIIYKL